MASTQHQNPFGGAPRIGNDAPGEPRPVPGTEQVQSFGSAPTLNGTIGRGEKAVNPDPSSEKYPKPYGGGNPFESYPDNAPASGSGANVGAGSTDGTDVP